MNRRLRRREHFDWFASHSRQWFEEVAATDSRHAQMSSTYGFYVAPKGTGGGMDDRMVEVLYGHRPFEDVKEFVPQEGGLPSLRQRFSIERGSSLMYERGDSGFVIVTIAPATTERYRPQETAIILEFMTDPSSLRAPPWLETPPRIEKHWRCLMSYLQCTSLDGDPTFADKIRLGWLRWTRPLIIEEKLVTPRWRSLALQIASWVLTVGLSGTVLFGLQWLFRDALK